MHICIHIHTYKHTIYIYIYIYIYTYIYTFIHIIYAYTHIFKHKYTGLLAGLFATGGPPLIWYTRHLDLEPVEIRANIAMIYCFESYTRVLFLLFVERNSSVVQDGTSTVIIIALLISSVCSCLFGNFLSQYIDKSKSRKVMLFLMQFGSVIIFSSDMEPLHTLLVFIYAIVVGLLQIVLEYAYYSIPSPAQTLLLASIPFSSSTGMMELNSIYISSGISRSGSSGGSSSSRGIAVPKAEAYESLPVHDNS